MKTIIVIVIAIGVFVLWYLLSYPTYTWHQKMTVEVETPEGVVSGSSVISARVSYNATLGIPEAASSSDSVRGEATIVELPNGQYLFVLLGDPVAMAQHSFKEEILGSFDAKFVNMETYYPKLSELRAQAPLLRDRYPLFVTFDDLNDPASVKEVNPDYLAGTFGQGYILKSVSLQITDEDVTKAEVEKKLGWINSSKVLKNPVWRNLSAISQKTIIGLKKPIGEK